MNRINKFLKYNVTRLISSYPGFNTNVLYKNQFDYKKKVIINNYFNRNENHLIKIHLKNIQKKMKLNNTSNSNGFISNNSYLKYLFKNNLIDTISYITDTNLDLYKDTIYYTFDKGLISKSLNDIDKKYINCIIKVDKSNIAANQIFIYNSKIDEEYSMYITNKNNNIILMHLLFINKDHQEISTDNDEKREKLTYYDVESLSIADVKNYNTK